MIVTNHFSKFGRHIGSAISNFYILNFSTVEGGSDEYLSGIKKRHWESLFTDYPLITVSTQTEG